MFTTNYNEIIAQLNKIDPVAYTRSRNFLDGSVTKLSPYITHGVFTLPQIRDAVLANYSFKESEKLLQELAWREFFRRVWEAKGDEIFTDLRFEQSPVGHLALPNALLNAKTTIDVLDTAITDLYNTGYIHNHARMWIAMLACNVGQAHWRTPATWLYYHLLDGDLASNSLSWQWVAGAFASKKYIANQENINKYSNTLQRDTYLDISYEALAECKVPDVLVEHSVLDLAIYIPQGDDVSVDNSKPVLLYHPWMLNPAWQVDTDAQRILLIEPAMLQRFPMSKQRIDFIMKLARNIKGIQILVANFDDTDFKNMGNVVTIEHPLVANWTAIKEDPDYLFPTVEGYFKNFFSYWKACQKTF